MIVLVTYDIADPKRLRSMHKYLKEIGLNTQKSVFECDISAEQIESMRQFCNKNLCADEDSVRIYKICSGCMEKVEVSGLGIRVRNRKYAVV